MTRSNLLELPPELLEEIAKNVPDEDLDNALQASSMMTRIITKQVVHGRISKILMSINGSALSKDRREILALLHLEKVRDKYQNYHVYLSSL